MVFNSMKIYNFIKKNMKTILVPVDFSDTTMATCKYALNFVGIEPARLFLFHIYPNQIMVADSSFPAGIDSDTFINAEFITELREQAEKNMTQLVKELNLMLPESLQTSIKIDSMVTGGDPEHEIKHICSEIKPDLMVMGTRGNGKKGFLEGSMAEKLMNATNIPVIAVPESFKKLRIRNIMYALNFSEYDFDSIKSVIELFNHVEKEIYIIHIDLNEQKTEEESMMDALEQSLRNTFPDEKFNFHVLNGSDKSIALNDIVDVFQIDLITFIAHKTSFFKNLFSKQIHKKDFFKLELPMLALHEPKD